MTLPVISLTRELQHRCVAGYGAPVLSICLAGCSVKCLGCASLSQQRLAGQEIDSETLAREIASASVGCRWAHVYGGEPLLHAAEDLQDILANLVANGMDRIVIETPMTRAFTWLRSWGEDHRVRVSVFARWRMPRSGTEPIGDGARRLLGQGDVIAFAIGDEYDGAEAIRVCQELPLDGAPTVQLEMSGRQRGRRAIDWLCGLDGALGVLARLDVRIFS